jgi:hypothetical protein
MRPSLFYLSNNMKIFLKKLFIFILILMTCLISVWYFYYWKRFSTLQDIDKELILESMKPDTNGKGYSDEGERMINHDIPLIKIQLSEKDSEDLVFWRREFLKRRRIMILSETRDAFLENAKKYYISFKCMVRHFETLDSTELSFDISKDENDNFYEYEEILTRKNFRFLKIEEIFNIQNPIEDYEFDKCFDELRK